MREDSSQTRRKNQIYIHGNYPSYYNYRHGATCFLGDEIDPRLKVVDKVLEAKTEHGLRGHLRGALCLDIGCNTGMFSRHLIQGYGARRVVGVDIDSSLITKAIRLVPKKLAKSFGFITEDYSSGMVTLTPERYDAIFCMSVTKWIHLNGGDEAIKRVFDRVHLELKTDGLLILEPQPWPTYARKKSITSTLAENYKGIELKPEMFSEYLAGIGFCLIASQDPDCNLAKGFQRPILIFRKLYSK